MFIKPVSRIELKENAAANPDKRYVALAPGSDPSEELKHPTDEFSPNRRGIVFKYRDGLSSGPQEYLDGLELEGVLERPGVDELRFCQCQDGPKMRDCYITAILPFHEGYALMLKYAP